MPTVTPGPRRKSTRKRPARQHPIDAGFRYLSGLQGPEGSIRVDYDGPLFTLPGYVFAHYATRTPIDDGDRARFIEFIRRHQNPDGGYGLHVEAPSYLFATVLNYVSLRLLGVAKDDGAAARAREWIRGRGGALTIPSWGRYWLAVLGLYEWEGINPVLPELWLLPPSFPLHPSRFWCHARQIYLVVSYLYGRRWRVPDEPLLAELRDELYVGPYDGTDFRGARQTVYAGDVFVPPNLLLRRLNDLLTVVEPLVPEPLRRRALDHVLDHIRHEQLATGFIDLGPVNKAFDVVACYAADPTSDHTRRAIAALGAYRFACERGVTMMAYHSSELWDTAFSLQALVESGRVDRFGAFAEMAFRFVDENQVREDVPERERYHRDASKGGWPFSNRAQGWPVADCTAEGLKAALEMEPFVPSPIAAERLFDAVDLLIDYQNPDGGWPTYERTRGNKLLELINPSEMFGDIMIEYSYVELTSAALQGLRAAEVRFGDQLGARRQGRLRQAVERGVAFLRGRQRADGSWEGAWGICFTYGTWFGVEGLLAGGARRDDPAIERAVDFLLGKQRADGGWGESYESCLRSSYVDHPDGGQTVMTAWALLALLASQAKRTRPAIEKGIRFLVERQLPSGDWPQQSTTGVFNRTCMLNYRAYRNYFPLWALGRAEKAGFDVTGGRA